jgi:hypothetical protein
MRWAADLPTRGWSGSVDCADSPGITSCCQGDSTRGRSAGRERGSSARAVDHCTWDQAVDDAQYYGSFAGLLDDDAVDLQAQAVDPHLPIPIVSQ